MAMPGSSLGLRLIAPTMIYAINAEPTMNKTTFSPLLFEAPFAAPDEALAADFLAGAGRDAAAERRIDGRAGALVEAIRAKVGGLGGIEDFLHAYSLSTKEGLAMMVLAEALLRVPDAVTSDRLIEDKLAAGRWLDGDIKSTALLVSASAWTLGIAARIIHPGETPETILDDIGRRLGLPALRAATRQAMRLIGSHFVLGQTIEEALHRARDHAEFRYSFDMLGEGARSAADAERYFHAYARPSQRSERAPAKPPCRAAWNFGEAHRAASALRSHLARVHSGGAAAASARARTHGQGPRACVYDRRRGSRPAGIVARRHRRRAARSIAPRLGRFWACGAGLSEARIGGDRLGRAGGRRIRQPPDRPPGQRRVLGHGDQTRTGAWT